MTESKAKREEHNCPHIPSREEFHRYTSNILSIEDFCTGHCQSGGRQTSKVASAIRWTKGNEIKINYKLRGRTI